MLDAFFCVHPSTPTPRAASILSAAGAAWRSFLCFSNGGTYHRVVCGLQTTPRWCAQICKRLQFVTFIGTGSNYAALGGVILLQMLKQFFDHLRDIISWNNKKDIWILVSVGDLLHKNLILLLRVDVYIFNCVYCLVEAAFALDYKGCDDAPSLAYHSV